MSKKVIIVKEGQNSCRIGSVLLLATIVVAVTHPLITVGVVVAAAAAIASSAKKD